MITFIYVDKESFEHVLEMPNPEWITDYRKIHNVTVRRAMSGKIRTYVVRDRKYSHAITYNMRFSLHRDEVRRFKKFIALSDGHYVWTKGTESQVSGQVVIDAPAGTHTIRLTGVTGSITDGNYAQVGGKYYNVRGVGPGSITVDPALEATAYQGSTVDVFKQQMAIITNQQFDFGSEDRAAGDQNSEENPGHLENVEDETYAFTVAILVIKT